MKLKINIIIIAFVASLLSGCTSSRIQDAKDKLAFWKKDKSSRMDKYDPLEKIGSVAIFPVINVSSEQKMDKNSFSNAISDELIKINRFRIMHANTVSKYLKEGGVKIDKGEVVLSNDFMNDSASEITHTDVVPDKCDINKNGDEDKKMATTPSRVLDPDMAYRKIGSYLGVDAVLVTIVNDYNPYEARVSLQSRLVITDKAMFNTEEVMMLSSYGYAFTGPGRKDSKPLWWYSNVFDHENNETRRRILAYSKRYYTKEHAMGPRIFVKVMPRYFGFIAYEMVRDLAIVTNPERYEKEYDRAEKKEEKRSENKKYDLALREKYR